MNFLDHPFEPDVNMPSPRVDLILEGRILALLDENKTYPQIIKRIKDTTGQLISRNKITQVKRRKKEGKENATPVKRGTSKMNKNKISRLKLFTMNVNPIPQREMASKLDVSQRTVCYHIHKTLKKDTKKKKKVHRLSTKNIKDRKRRAPEFKRIVDENKFRIVTTDESMFSVQLGGGKRDIYYADSKTIDNQKKDEFFEREERFSSKIMVWGGVSYYGKTNLYFIKPGTKIKGEYYQKFVIKKFMERDKKRMFGDGEFLFHQDSAPSHVSKSTIDYFTRNNIPVIPKDKWPPKSPDLAPMDYFVWGWIKRRVRKSKFETTAGLKRAIIRAWKALPQKFIQNAFDKWSDRVQKVINAEGGHI